MKRERPRLWRASLAAVSGLALLWPCRAGLGWGHEGHPVVGLIAEHYMTGAALAKAGDLLGRAATSTPSQAGPTITGTITQKPGPCITSTYPSRMTPIRECRAPEPISKVRQMLIDSHQQRHNSGHNQCEGPYQVQIDPRPAQHSQS
jgi:hypothetical protein